MSVVPAREGGGQAPLEIFHPAAHKTRISRAFRAMRDCQARFDFDGAVEAEQRMNDELDLLSERLHERSR